MELPSLVNEIATKAGDIKNDTVEITKDGVKQKVEGEVAEKKDDKVLDGTKTGAFLRAILFVKGPIRCAATYTDLRRYKDLEYLVKNWRIPHAADKLELGAWHYLPAAATPSLAPTAVSDELSKSALRNSNWPVVLFLHGLGCDRVSSNHRRFGNALARANIQSLHLDYRGYGDSTKNKGVTDKGVVSDAIVGVEWLQAAGVPVNNITIVGYSLGTGIAAALAEGLLLKGLTPKALVLIAAYTAIADILTTYRPGGTLPFGKPLDWYPGLKVGIIRRLPCPILLVHARNDRALDCTNSEKLFQATMGHDKVPEQLKHDFTSAEVGAKNHLRTFLRKEENLKRGDQWPVVSYLETEKGVREEGQGLQYAADGVLACRSTLISSIIKRHSAPSRRSSPRAGGRPARSEALRRRKLAAAEQDASAREVPEHFQVQRR